MNEFKVGDVLVAPAGESVNGNPPRKSAVRVLVMGGGGPADWRVDVLEGGDSLWSTGEHLPGVSLAGFRRETSDEFRERLNAAALRVAVGLSRTASLGLRARISPRAAAEYKAAVRALDEERVEFERVRAEITGERVS